MSPRPACECGKPVEIVCPHCRRPRCAEHSKTWWGEMPRMPGAFGYQAHCVPMCSEGIMKGATVSPPTGGKT